ncbi:MAG: heavy metal-associated domain-containing protein [Azonexus sp.]|nr:heavy metal-associated domain-containing protein [Azonexus sp.]MDP3639224.1 heavy metal-associated domain-containing protein [Azonexus sp.]MDZ4314413.1 heavy metal-associated domain-containing protein [Azonexus sp.]
MENTVIKVGGMSCQGCVKNITDVLSSLAGVSSAVVSLDAGEAKLVYDPQQVSREVLLTAIEDAGFDAE